MLLLTHNALKIRNFRTWREESTQESFFSFTGTFVKKMFLRAVPIFMSMSNFGRLTKLKALKVSALLLFFLNACRLAAYWLGWLLISSESGIWFFFSSLLHFFASYFIMCVIIQLQLLLSSSSHITWCSPIIDRSNNSSYVHSRVSVSIISLPLFYWALTV